MRQVRVRSTRTMETMTYSLSHVVCAPYRRHCLTSRTARFPFSLADDTPTVLDLVSPNGVKILLVSRHYSLSRKQISQTDRHKHTQSSLLVILSLDLSVNDSRRASMPSLNITDELTEVLSAVHIIRRHYVALSV